MKSKVLKRNPEDYFAEVNDGDIKHFTSSSPANEGGGGTSRIYKFESR